MVKKWIFNDLNWILSDKKQDIGEQVEMKCILTLANKIRTGTGWILTQTTYELNQPRRQKCVLTNNVCVGGQQISERIGMRPVEG